jgi:hypothetical protein
MIIIFVQTVLILIAKIVINLIHLFVLSVLKTFILNKRFIIVNAAWIIASSAILARIAFKP